MMPLEWLLGISFLLFGLFALGLMVWPFRKRNVVKALGVGVLVGMMAVMAYVYWGDWGAVGRLASMERLSRMKPDALIATLKIKVAQTPNNPQGWYLLGRLYVGQEQWPLALDAFKKAHDLNPNDALVTINYAHTLWVLNQQRLTRASRSLYEGVLQQNPNQPDALIMLANDAYHHKKFTMAIEYWQRLLLLLPVDSKEAQDIKKTITFIKGRHHDGSRMQHSTNR